MYSPIVQTQSGARSPDGTMVAVTGFASVNILDATSGATMRVLPTRNESTAVAFSPDSKLIAVGGIGPDSYNPLIEIWNASTGALVETFTMHAGPVSCLAFSPDGKTLASGGFQPYTTTKEGFVQTWNLASGGPTRSYATADFFNIYGLAFSPNGLQIAASGVSASRQSGEVETWNVLTGSLLHTFATASGFVNTVSFTPDGATLVGGGGLYSNVAPSIGTLELWNPSTGAAIASLPTAAIPVESVAFSSDGATLAVGGGQPHGTGPAGVLEVWNMTTRTVTTSLPTQETHGILFVGLSPDGKKLVDAGTGGVATVGLSETDNGLMEWWDVSEGALTNSQYLSPAPGPVSIALSPDGKTIAAAGGGNWRGFPANPSFLTFWSVATGKEIGSISSAPMSTQSAAYSPDGTLIATGSQEGIYLWNTSTGQLLSTLPSIANNTEQYLEFSPDGKTLLLCGSMTGGTRFTSNFVELWNVSSGTLLHTLDTSPIGSPDSAVFSPDGKYIAVGGTNFVSGEGSLGIWKVSDFSFVQTLPTKILSGVYRLIFSPDGKYLADSGNGIADVEVWKVSNFKLQFSISSGVVGPFFGTNLTFSPDSKTLMLNSATGIQAVSIPGGSNLGAYYSNGESGAFFTPDAKKIAFCGPVSALGVMSNPFTTPLVSEVSVAPDTVSGGTSATGTVTLNKAAANGGLSIQLISSDPSVYLPGAITVPVGKNSVTFQISTKPVSTLTAALITASSGADSAHTILTITPPSVASFTVSPTTVTGGTTAMGTLTLNGVAPAGGLTVSLSSDNSGATVPATVVVPASHSIATFPVTTVSLVAPLTVTLTASFSSITQTTSFIVSPPSVTALVLSPSTVTGGASSIASVTLGGPAPRGGVAVTLSSGNSTASVPASILVAGGKSTATFTVGTVAVTSQTTATIMATIGSSGFSAPLTIAPMSLASVKVTPSSVKGGQLPIGTVTLTGIAPAGGIVVNLSSSSPYATVPLSVTVAAGKSSATFGMSTKAVKSNTQVTITATAGTTRKTTQMSVTK
jgi:WD40 repeat protein